MHFSAFEGISPEALGYAFAQAEKDYFSLFAVLYIARSGNGISDAFYNPFAARFGHGGDIVSMGKGIKSQPPFSKPFFKPFGAGFGQLSYGAYTFAVKLSFVFVALPTYNKFSTGKGQASCL